jgi:hypothetical protein
MSTPIIAAPRFGRLRDAERHSGLRRGKLYELASANPGLFRKAGAATLVDLQKLDDVLAALPAADLKEPAVQ